MSFSYVQVWVLYHMDLHYILCLFIPLMDLPCIGLQPWVWLLVSMIQHTDVLHMPTWQHDPIEPTFSSHGDDLFSQSSRLSYPSKTHALGEHPVITKSYHHHVIRHLTYLLSLNPNSWSGTHANCQSSMKIPSTMLSPLSRSGTLFARPIPYCPQAVPLLMTLSP